MPIRLVLADDHPLVLDGLTHLFEGERDFDVTARCVDGEEAVRATLEQQPDVLVLDLRMPRKDGLAAIRELKERLPRLRIVVLTAALDEDDVLEAIRLGIDGVVLKEMAPRLLIQCLRKVHAGGQWLERRAVGRALERFVHREAARHGAAAILTQREIDLVRLVAAGHSNRGIAEQLRIAEGTVKVHLHRIYEKLDVKSRVALTLYAQRTGLT